jgi:glycine C-acetyltransferase
MHQDRQAVIQDIQRELNALREAGLFKSERIITTPQSAVIKTTQGKEVLNFCANNYLGLSSHPAVIRAGKEAIDTHGFGMSSVRFICGTQDIHKELETRISRFVGQEDAILYAAAFDANGGLFEPLLNEEDVIISDMLNHASIIDGIRLCKAQRLRYESNDMTDLEAKLQEAKKLNARRILIATDGVFSMDGIIAQVDKICDLADQYGAMVMVDDCHATGFIGKTGRGSAGTLWGSGPRRYHHRNIRQSIGWRVRRLYCRQKRNCGATASKIQAISVFKYTGTFHCRSFY